MKKGLLFITIMLMATMAWADCKETKGVCYEIVSIEYNEQFKNILVSTNYYLNGVLIQEGGSRYSWENFFGMTDKEKITRIESDCETHAKNLILRKYSEVKNTEIGTSGISGLIGKSKAIETTKVSPTETKELEVKADGTTVSVSDITPIVVE